MKPLTLEWIEKAEEDWDVMLKAYRARKNPAYNATCFHAQQCVEKYLKAFLQESNIAFPRTHDLSDLLGLTLSIEPGWVSMQPDLNTLSAFAVEYRYPGESSDIDEAKEAVQKCDNVRGVVRRALGL